MSMTSRATEVCQSILSAARLMKELGLVTGCEGNVSARYYGGFYITPTGIPPEDMAAEDMVYAYLGNAGAKANASCEWRMHREIYRLYEEVGAVVHTHADPHPSWDVAPYAPEGSQELADNVRRTLAKAPAYSCGLERHGTVTMGKTMDEALELARYA